MSSLRATVLSGVATAFTAIGDIATALTIKRVTPGVYDQNTGKTGAPTTADHACAAVVSRYKQSEIDGTVVKATDHKVLVRQEALPISPTTTDRAVIGGQTYAILDVRSDAASATWTLQVRA